MEYATIRPAISEEHQCLYYQNDLYCEHCGQRWSPSYNDYAGMQDLDFIVCSCGEAICQVGELKNA